MTFTIARVDPDAVRPLRHAILRSHQPYDAVRYAGDDAPDTAHFAAYDDAGEIVGTATALRQPLPDAADAPDAADEGSVWRLRGMTTTEQVRGTGAGGRLLAAVVEHATAHGATLIWCNARSAATGFYERYGWVKISDEFVDGDAGPHYRMTRSTSGSM